VQLPESVVTTAGGFLPKTTWAVRISLVFAGLMVSLPFLNFHHSYPLATFHTEWLAFALGGVALLAAAFDTPEKSTRVPYLSLGLIGLTLVLLAQIAVGRVAYVERSLLGTLYLLWAALLVWLAAHLRERCGIERLAFVVQVFLALGGLLVACSGFVMLYGIDVFGFSLTAGAGMEGSMVGTIAQRNGFANYLGCALASVVFLLGRRRIGLLSGTLIAVPLILALVLSTSRGALLYVALTGAAAFWLFWRGDRERLRPLLGFALLVVLASLGFSAGLSMVEDAHIPTQGGRWAATLSSDWGRYDMNTRLYFLAESWSMFTAHPLLGAGFGEFAWNLFDHGLDPQRRGGGVATHAHNALFELLAETGALGTLCIVVPLVLWLRAFRWRDPTPEGAWLATLLAIEAVHSATEFPLWYATFLGLAAVLVGSAPQPEIHLQFTRFRRAALIAVLVAGLLAMVSVLFDYRAFERWYLEADASQRRGLPLSERQVSELIELRGRSLFVGYYDLLASELFVLDRENLDAKLELNTRVLRFVPIPTVAFRQAALLALAGEHENAVLMLSRLAAMYPGELPQSLARLERMAREDPEGFSALAAEARRRF